jgi:hypothetical protein
VMGPVIRYGPFSRTLMTTSDMTRKAFDGPTAHSGSGFSELHGGCI